MAQNIFSCFKYQPTLRLFMSNSFRQSIIHHKIIHMKKFELVFRKLLFTYAIVIVSLINSESLEAQIINDIVPGTLRSITETQRQTLSKSNSVVNNTNIAALTTAVGLQQIFSSTGFYTLSADGIGSTNFSMNIRVNKPSAQATVQKAFLISSATPNSSIANGCVTIAGVPINWDGTASVSFFRNYWADVTAIVAPQINNFPSGISTLPITECNSSVIDGEALLVVFNDPAAFEKTIIIMSGAMNPAGDNFSVTLAQPIDPNQPGALLDMGLGIGFGFQSSFGGGQTSHVSVNAQRITSAAGGEDDGAPSNGALITVGGIGDVNTNPANPFAAPTNLRSDDELYSLLPFINNSTTSLNVTSYNPSGDDNIFLAYFLFSGAAIIGEGILLSQTSSSGEIGTDHTVKAVVLNSLGQPVVNRSVTFTITSGPNAGGTYSTNTNASGEAYYTYTGSSNAGTDNIQACFTNSQSQLSCSNTLSFEWLAPAQTISTNSLSNSVYCPGATLQISYTAVGSYNAGNIFSAELSSASGSFITPTVIGTVNATTSGTINATIPSVITYGTGYRIRVVSSSPVVTGTDNGNNLTIGDNQNPTFSCPANQNVNLNNSCQLVVPDLVSGLTGTDNCGTVTFTQSPAAGVSLSSSHNLTHNVVITASDGNGNTAQCTVVLTSKDVNKPTFVCPDNPNVDLNATCQLIVPNLIAELTGSDNCGTVTFTQSPLPGASLASSHNQTHHVLITANDGNGNTRTCTVVLTGKDVTKPTFICPYNQNVNLNGTCQLVVPNLIAGLTGSDNCGTVTFTQSPLAGASLTSSHNQTHNVLITASDGNGNIQTCTVILTGKDVTKPTFTCPGNQNVNLTATCQLVVPNLIAELTGNDNCGTVTFTQNPVAGTPLASSHNQTHNIVITASDGNGNTQTCTVVLTGKDVTLPVITCPSAKTISCDASILPANTGSATAGDNCGGNPLITYSDVSGQDPNPLHAAYYNYTITRTWKAQDAAGNTNTCNQTITVQDITDPDITCPADKLNVPFDFGQLYATINIGSATATDNCAAAASMTINGVRSDNVAISNQQYPSGQTTVAWSAADPSGNSDECTQTITVRKRNTIVTYTGDMIDNKICVQYSDIINLQAKLTDNEGLVTPNNISGRTITFQLLSGTTLLRSKNATTNTAGVAVDSFKIDQAPGMYKVKTIFTGDSYFNGSYDLDDCEVKQEDALVEYNGSQYFTTASATTMTGTVTVAASVNDINDGSDKRGDIRKAKATFRDGGAGGSLIGSANLPVGLVTPNVLTNGISAATQNYTLNSNEASSGGKILQVWVGASDHYKGADAGPTPVTLALPGQDFVTGGGNLVLTNSAGTYAGTLNSKMNFGFAMKWNKSGKNLQGQINIVFRKWQLYNGEWQWRVYQAKSNAISSMAVVEVGSNGQPASATNPAVFRKAIINTKANLKDVTDPLNNGDLGGNHNLVLEAWDHITANGGTSDKISVMLMGATTNELLFSSSWVSNATAAQTITGGNINVKNNSPSSATTRNTSGKNAEMEIEAKAKVEFVVRAYPNPSAHQFTFTINSNMSESVQVSLYDATGRKIETFNARTNELIRFGEKLKAGIYFAQVRQGNNQETIKLIKQ